MKTWNSGFSQIVVSVSDLSRTAAVWIEDLGYEYVIPPSPLSGSFFEYWKLPSSSEGRFCVLANPGDANGFLRLICLDKVPRQIQMRSSSAAWDTGGFYDFNIRVRDVDACFLKLQRKGWQGVTDPKVFDFGSFRVKEVLMRSFDGEIVALIERISPPLEGFPNLKTASHIFNSTQIVQDMSASLHFYDDILCFTENIHHRAASTEDGVNVMGLPKSLAVSVIRNVYILHPTGSNDGSIELIEMEKLEGENRSEFCRLPNLGILAVRFPVDDLQSGKQYFLDHNVRILYEGSWDAQGSTKGSSEITISSPDGALLSFYGAAD